MQRRPVPPRATMGEALERMLEHHGVADPAARRHSVVSGDVHRLARSLRELHRDKLAASIAAPASAA